MQYLVYNPITNTRLSEIFETKQQAESNKTQIQSGEVISVLDFIKILEKDFHNRQY